MYGGGLSADFNSLDSSYLMICSSRILQPFYYFIIKIKDLRMFILYFYHPCSFNVLSNSLFSVCFWTSGSCFSSC